MTQVYEGPPRIQSGARGFRLFGEAANYLGYIYAGLTAGTWLGTLAFKIRVLGFWDGFRDFGGSFANPLELIVRLLVLAPAFILIWLAGALEKRAVRRGLEFRGEEVRSRAPGIVAATLMVSVLCFALFVMVSTRAPNPYDAGVYDCSSTNCRDHEAGYAWAAERFVISADECAVDRSRTFREGCRYFVERTEIAADGEE